MTTSMPYRTAEQRQDDSDDEDEIGETGFKTTRDAILFAIEISDTMLNKQSGDFSAAIAALRCAFQLMQQRIITNPKDRMGILLFGTEQTFFGEASNDMHYPHCYLLQDLDVPAATDIKRLRKLVDDEDEQSDMFAASNEDVSMANVLFCANQIFTTRAANFASRRLFIVTDNDNPHADKKELRSSAAVRAKDLYDLGVLIELFPISRVDHDFDRTTFYDDIVYQVGPDVDAQAPVAEATKPATAKDGLSLLQSLLQSVMSRNADRRVLSGNVPMELGPGLVISVNLYVIFKHQVAARSHFCFTQGEKTQLASQKTRYQAFDTEATVEKADVRKAYSFGGESVTFSIEEVAAVRDFGDRVIRIVGFKPLQLLPIWANVRPASFVYPSDEAYVGSTRTFSALHQSMLNKDVMALCWCVTRRGASPSLCALVPGGAFEVLEDEKKKQLLPAGLWLVRLPFADDIREMPDRLGVIRASDDLVDKMRQVVQQLQLPKSRFDPSRYPNPALQWHYRVLQAMALDEDVPERAADATLPRCRQIHKRAGAFISEWGEALNAEMAATQPARDKKRQADYGGPPAKKTKVDSQTDIRKSYRDGTLSKLTVAQLKEFANAQSILLPSSGKKAEVVAAIERYLDKHPG